MQDEFYVQSPQVNKFIEVVRATLADAGSIVSVLQRLRPHFAALLQDQNWLPDQFCQPDETSVMGNGIATWLIFRDGRGDLSLFALVVPPGAATPVHDHLAWGLVGLYAGEQDEEVYEHDQPNGHEQSSHLKLVATNHLQAGDFYELLPPNNDIHRVRTTSLVPSVSLHLLGNDTGCVWRHRYEPEAHTITPFRSGYTNRPCAQEEIL